MLLLPNEKYIPDILDEWSLALFYQSKVSPARVSFFLSPLIVWSGYISKGNVGHIFLQGNFLKLGLGKVCACVCFNADHLKTRTCNLRGIHALQYIFYMAPYPEQKKCQSDDP